MTEPEIDGPQRRGILVLMKKNLGLKVARIEELNYNLVKIYLERERAIVKKVKQIVINVG